MALEINLQDIDWKQVLRTVLNILMDPKILVALVGIGLVIWQSNETFFMPVQKEIAVREDALKKQHELISQRQQTKGQYEVWQRELQGLSVSLYHLEKGDNARIVALSKSSELLELARSLGSNPDDPNALPPPHDKLEHVSIAALGNTTIDVMAGPEGSPQDGQNETGKVEGAPPGVKTARGEAPVAGEGSAAASVMLEKFDYEMSMQGTYAALARFINELVSRDNLVVINEITLSKPSSDGQSEPDPAEFPDYPVPVQMHLKLSIYLFDAKGGAQQ